MTRINCVPPEELINKHLAAEYRELPRIFSLVQRARWKDIPGHYTMGKGHLKFFYPRVRWCWWRWLEVREEMIKRGFKVDEDLYKSIKKSVDKISKDAKIWGSWKPSEKAMEINRQRIEERLRGMK